MNNKQKLLNDSMAGVLESLTGPNSNSKLPEELFVKNFLPFFTGQVDIANNEDFLPVWISIAGSPTSDVDIIDSRNKVLFTVPAFLDSGVINTVKTNTSLSFTEIIALSTLYGNNIPKQGAQVLTSELEAKIEKLKGNSPTFTKKIETWQHIFKRYNIQSQKDNNPVQESTVKKTSNVSDDDFE